MRRLSYLVAALLTVGTLVGLPARTAAAATTTAEYSVSVTCTSTGQLCLPASTVEGVTTTGVLWAAFTASPDHCSSIRIHFSLDGSARFDSPFLAPGESTGVVDLTPTTIAGSHTVSIQAEGQVGGCNNGSLASWSGMLAITTGTTGPADVLILGTSVSNGSNSIEAIESRSLGFVPEIVDDPGWRAKSASAFAAYKALILGDPTCVGTPSGFVTAAEATTGTWTPAVTGNAIVIGTDPVYHTVNYPGDSGVAANHRGPRTVINNGIKFAAAQAGKTGVYVSLSCYYVSATTPVAPAVLGGFASTAGGAFAVRSSGEDNNVHIVAAHPALAGLTDTILSNWGNSTHESFTTWPSDFTPLAIAVKTGGSFRAADGTIGDPYIVARGATPISAISLQPVSATRPVGATHTLTANVTVDGAAVPGKTVTFTVTSGPNAGKTGTATTDGSGNASFTYTGATIGTDTVHATFVDSTGKTQTSNDATVVWVALTGTAQCVEINGTTITTFLLPLASVTLTQVTVSPSVSPIIVSADPTTATFVVTGLAPNTQFTASFSGTNGTRSFTCSVLFTTDQFGAGTVPPPDPKINYKNGTWFSPKRLVSGQPVVDRIADFHRQGGVWYAIFLPANTRVIVTVTGGSVTALPYDLVALGYGDLRRIGAGLKVRSTSVPALKGVIAGIRVGDDSIGDDSIGDDSIGDDSIGDDSIGDDSIGDDSIGDDSIGDDSIGADVADLGDFYGSAEAVGLRAVSQKPGTSAEALTLTARNRPGDVYFRVRGHEHAFDNDKTFTVTATIDGINACPAAIIQNAPTTTTVTAGGYHTLLLTNLSRLSATPLDPARSAFVSKLADLAKRPEVVGVVIDLGTDTGIATNYAAMDAQKGCVPQANAVAQSIHQLIDLYRANNPIENVALIGGADVVPYWLTPDRVPDSLGPESRYDPPVDPLSFSDASLGGNYVQTSNFYAAAQPTTVNDRDVWIPDDGIAVGRLVETVADITRYIDQYILSNGVLAPRAATATAPAVQNKVLISAYDWNADLGNAVAAELGAGTTQLSVDTSLIRNNWTAVDLTNKLLVPPVGTAADRYGIVAPFGHFTATRLVPASGADRVLSTDLDVSDGRFADSFWLTLGCHSGYSIVNADIVLGRTQPDAFPEVLLRQGVGGLVGQTGYGYGGDSTAILENTEVVLARLIRELRTGPGPVSPAKALTTAKRFHARNLSALPLRPVDEKVLNVAQFFGMPTYRIDIAGDRHAVTALEQIATQTSPTPVATAGSNFDALAVTTNTTGLFAANVTPVYTLQKNGAGFFEAFQQIGGETVADATASPGRPFLPRAVVSAEPQDRSLLARGVVLRSARYHDVAHAPIVQVAVTENPQGRATYTNNAFLPAGIVSLNELADQTAVFTLGQLNMGGSTTSGTLRLYDTATVTVYYSNQTGAAALDSPVIFATNVTKASGTNLVHVDVTVRTRTDPGVEDVFATYRTTGGPGASLLPTSWKSVALKPAGAPAVNGLGFVTHYTTGLLGAPDIDPENGDPTTVELFIQAVGSSGLVTTATNNGKYFKIPPATPPAPTSLTIEPLVGGTTLTYRSLVAVTATLTDALGAPLAGKLVSFGFGGNVQASAATDAAGHATVSQLLVNTLPGERLLTAIYRGDSATLPSTASRAVTVLVAPMRFNLTPVTLHYPEDADVGTLAVSATLQPRPEQAITIRLPDGRTLATTTDGTGHVRFSTRDFGGVGPGSYAVLFQYAGDGVKYAATSDLDAANTVVVTVLHDVTITFETPPQPENTPFTVTVKVTPTTQLPPGALTLATVTFHFTSALLSFDLTVVTSVAADGTASITLPAGLPAGVFTVTATVGGFFSGSSSTILAVFDQSTFVTGGGWVLTTPGPSPTSIGVPAGKKANFGFNLKYLNGTTTPTGSLLFQLKEANIDFKSTGFDWLVITSGQRAEYEGSGTINRAGSFKVHVIATTTTGSPRTFEIRIWDPATGGTFATPTYLIENSLGGGNIVVH